MIALGPTQDTPAIRQIAASMRTLLVAGQYAPGEQLPTVRKLAAELKVHHNTVAGAYRVLAREGWLKLYRKRGAIVQDRPLPTASPQAWQAFARQLRELVAKAVADGVAVPALAAELVTLGHALEAEASADTTSH